jgi:hypothetical protein
VPSLKSMKAHEKYRILNIWTVKSRSAIVTAPEQTMDEAKKGRLTDMPMGSAEMRAEARLDPATLDAFERELTPDVARRLLELAARRTTMLRAAGVIVGSDDARQLVRDAIADTLDQVAPWRPEEISLVQHLRGLIRRRTWARLAQSDGPLEPGRGALAVIEQVTLALSYDSAEDAAVRLVLEAYCNGATTGEEVSSSCGITLEEYGEARRRLDQMLAALPMPGVAPRRERARLPMWSVP